MGDIPSRVDTRSRGMDMGDRLRGRMEGISSSSHSGSIKGWGLGAGRRWGWGEGCWGGCFWLMRLGGGVMVEMEGAMEGVEGMEVEGIRGVREG